MLLFDIFVTTFRQAKLPELSTDELISLSSHSFSQQDLEHAFKRVMSDNRVLYYEFEGEEISKAQSEYANFLQECRLLIGSQQQAFILPIIINYFGECNNLEACCELFDYNLSDQKDALSIASLGRNYIQQPTSFAAFLIWLRGRGVSVDDILATYILQDYTLYHLVDVNDCSDPRQTVYQILLNFAQTRTLGLAMAQTACPSPDNELAYFALNGEISHSGSLKVISKVDFQVHITPLKRNVDSLDRLFGINLLIHALQHPNSMSPLKALMKNNLSSVLSKIEENSKSVFDLTTIYTLLLKFLNKNKIEGQDFVFKALIKLFLDAIVQYPLILDDSLLLLNLRNFANSSTILPIYAAEVVSDFKEACLQDPLDIIYAKDAWIKVCRQISGLQEICPHLQADIPENVYNFYAYLAKLKSSQLGVWFNLKNFIKQLNFDKKYASQEVTSYEKLLVEFLVTIDLPNIRAEIIAELEEVILPPRNFLQTNYQGPSLMHRAVLNSNMGVVVYLHKNGLQITKDDLNSFVKSACKQGDWSIVTYFHRKFDLAQDVVNNILQEMISQHSSDFISSLFLDGKAHPDLRIIEKLFLKSATNGNIACLIGLMNCPIPPCITVIIKAFNNSLAVTPPLFNVAKILANYKSDNILFADAICSEFIKASRVHDSIRIITLLKNNPAINQKTVDQAFIAAIRAGMSENAECIRVFGIITPSKGAIAKAYRRPGRSRATVLDDSLPSLNYVKNFHKKRKGKSNFSKQDNSKPGFGCKLPSIDKSIANLARHSYFEHSLNSPESKHALQKQTLKIPNLVRHSSC